MINHSKAEFADNQPGDAMRTYAELRRRQRAAEATDEVADRLIGTTSPFSTYTCRPYSARRGKGGAWACCARSSRTGPMPGGNRARKAFADTEGAFWAA